MPKHTVPAMRHIAAELRAKADEAENEMKDLRASADRIDAMADAEEAAQQAAATPPVSMTVPCWNCSQPVVHDGLSWRHVPGSDETRCQVPGVSENDSALPPNPTVTVTSVDTPEVAQ